MTVLTRGRLGLQKRYAGGARFLPNRLGGPFQIELFGTFQLSPPAAGAQALFREAAERGAEVNQGWLMQIEDVRVQKKAVAGQDGESIQVRHAKYEGAGPVGQAAGGRAGEGSRFKQPGIDAGRNLASRKTVPNAPRTTLALLPSGKCTWSRARK